MNALGLLTLPQDVQDAVWTLHRHGVDFQKIVPLLLPRRRGRPRKVKRTGTRAAKRGAPSSLPFTMKQFSDFVDACKNNEGCKTDVDAIRELLAREAKKQGCTMRRLAQSLPHRGERERTLKMVVRSLQQHLSRHRKVSSECVA